MKMISLFLSGMVAAAAITSAAAQAPDNTKANARPINSKSGSSTADGQSNSASDIALTQKIRKSVMDDKHLSTYAHNVKIVSVNGAVTLNGVVRNSQEKLMVAKKAQAIAGHDKVTDDMTIAPNS